MSADSKSTMNRRTFGACCGALAGAVVTPVHTFGLQAEDVDKRLYNFQDQQNVLFRPCVDVDPELLKTNRKDELRKEELPVREDKSRSLPTSVDYLLLEQNESLADLLSNNPEGDRGVARAPMENPDDERELQRGLQAANLPGTGAVRLAFKSKWDKTTIRVFFYSRGGGAFASEILKIGESWAEETGSNINLREATDPSNSDLRVGFASTGHWSYVGLDNTKRPGQQTMNLDIPLRLPEPGEYNYGVILHEFGHAFGCIHEHQSPSATNFFDRDEVLKYYELKYGWSRPKTELNVLHRYDKSTLIKDGFSTFDEFSVMLYSYPKELTQDRKGTRVNSKLSRVDKQYFAKLYGGTFQPGDNGNGTKPEPTIQKLVIGGSSSPQVLEPNSSDVFELEVKDESKPWLVIDGYTLTKVKIMKEGSSKPLEFPIGTVVTSNLINSRRQILAGSGKYRIEVSHAYAEGSGEYKIRVVSENDGQGFKP